MINTYYNIFGAGDTEAEVTYKATTSLDLDKNIKSILDIHNEKVGSIESKLLKNYE